MKKLKVLFITTAIVLALGSAFATRVCNVCDYSTQYIFSMGAWQDAGEIGYDYVCTGTTGVCTYYRPNPIFQPNYYAPCKAGNYVIIP
ncbi:hypothetical protein A4D02_15710 [Niastella koreensis]|nr:DUF6520 family protein [Niastella koreensis]OQP40361.1 hypothetical protein A4D02_15710 [Niastella koreensis]